MEVISVPDGAMARPDYAGPCICNLVPALLEHRPLGEGWIPDRALDAEQVVLLLIDGMGWNQLARRRYLAPRLAGSDGVAITTVAPTTTASALASLTTGATPGEHGLVGYRIRTAGETLNTLRWTTERGDARTTIPPEQLQPLPTFGNRRPVIITRGEFAGSGFTKAHLEGGRFRGYGTTSTLVYEIAASIEQGERFVYAYYDGLDRVGHERGHGPEFDAEYAFVDQLVDQIRDLLPAEVALVVTADHGQVHTGDDLITFDRSVTRLTRAVSGEARFAWLHAKGGAADPLFGAVAECHGDRAWVLTVDEVVELGLLGARVAPDARSRLGDVAVIAKDNVAFVEPDANPSILIGRHGSLTADELFVPLLFPC